MILSYVIVALILANTLVCFALFVMDIFVRRIFEVPESKYKILLGPEKWRNDV